MCLALRGALCFASHMTTATNSHERTATMATSHITDYGTATIGTDSVHVAANGSELSTWAHRPGAHWPCSELAEASEITATFDSNGLYDLTGDDEIDLSGDELSAWVSDVLREVLPAEHPCHFVTVGQFDAS